MNWVNEDHNDGIAKDCYFSLHCALIKITILVHVFTQCVDSNSKVYDPSMLLVLEPSFSLVRRIISSIQVKMLELGWLD